MKTKHILSARQFGKDEILEIFRLADEMKEVYRRGPVQVLAGCKGVINLFCQRSTRTFSSFEIALDSLGGIMLCSLASYEASSFAKGESVEDTIRYYCESYQPHLGAIILRHPQEGAAEEAANAADDYGVSIINAGDGTNEHPTQALLDLYTMWKRRNRNLDGVKLVVGNDLKGRTIRSLCLLLARNFKVRMITTCAPQGSSSLPSGLVSELLDYNVAVWPTADLKEAIKKDTEFVYWTRPQKEYYDSPELLAAFRGFQITEEFFDSLPPENSLLVMHPMPVDSETFNEITPAAKAHPRCIMIEQAANGLPIRMALLKMLLYPN